MASKFRIPFKRTATDHDLTQTMAGMDKDDIDMQAMEKDATVVETTPAGEGRYETGSPEEPTKDAQEGVKRAEAVTLTWSRTSLIVVYITMFLLYFVNAFQSSITSNLTAYVVSGFELHSLIPVIYIVANCMQAVTYLPVAKMLDIWGRSEGFLVMMTLATLGLVLMAVTSNIQTYCAAQVFYGVGFSGMIYTIDVITADTSTLRNRGLAFAFTSSPYVITAFAGPNAAQGFYEQISWRWAFGTFAIILPVVASPLFFILQVNQRRALKAGLIVKKPSGRTFVQNVWHYAVEFDALGVILLGAGLVIFLLPFSLADSAPNGWKTAYIIAMIVLGVVLLVGFGLHERFLASKPFIPFELLASRTVSGICLFAATWQIAYYCWNSYFSSFLQVVNGLTIAQAGYVGGVFDIISGLWLFLIGFVIRKTGYFKWLLWCATPLYMLAVGLMIYFRHPGTSVGYLVMCQVFIAFAGSTMILCEQVGIMAAAAHQHVAAVLAMLGLFGYIGGAIGNSISGAIWTNSFPDALAELLPESAQADLESIYGDLTVQLSYPMGDPVREAIMEAYGIAQQRMLIAGTAIMVLALIWVAIIKNLNVSKIQQTKGRLF